MANWCSVEAEIVCIDGQEAETLYQKLLTDKTEADKRDHGYIFKIHPRCYIFYTYVWKNCQWYFRRLDGSEDLPLIYAIAQGIED